MEAITVETTVKAPAEKVWKIFNEPAHIVVWNVADPAWHTPRATNDLRVGGTFNTRMEAKDGSTGFDFIGTYDEVVPQTLIRYTMADGRRVSVMFEEKDGETHVTETFDPENQNPREMQQAGWQAILDNFKTYVESH
jgi:uncharacterized protein YndB with AHSA1/START domain